MSDQLQPFLLCVQDPADPLNDLGHKAFGIKHIKETLSQLHRDLQTSIALRPLEPYIVLQSCLADAYSTIRKRRALIEGFVPGQAAAGERPSDAIREAFALKDSHTEEKDSKLEV
jgi:DNA polymerase sigma